MNWKIEEKFLTKEFEFSSFPEAVGFVNKILPLTEEADHHPDILIHSYKKVKIMLYTHSEDKVTEEDYSLAKKIDILMNEKPSQATLDQWHRDPTNWKFGIFYYNPEDPRIFPPKRIPTFGWTVNFANPRSYLSLLGIGLVMEIIKKKIFRKK